MIEYFNSLLLWQKIAICVMCGLFLFSLIVYIREIIVYHKRRKVKTIQLNLIKITEDNYLVLEIPDKINMKQLSMVYLNNERSEFKMENGRLYVKASDILENTYVLEFCIENSIIFAKGVIEIDDSFPRPQVKAEEEKVVYVAEPKPEVHVIEVIETKPAETETVKVEEEVAATEEEDDNDGESDESEVIIVNGERIVISYNYSFQARLIQSSEEVRNWYRQLINEIESYKDLKYKQSWKRIRIYKGRKTIAQMRFRGKKICMAYALDPQKYVNTQYEGIDLSDKKVYKDTPMMVKITSERRFKYQLHMLNEVCKENGIEQGEVVAKKISIPAYMEKDKLIQKELIKVNRRTEIITNA